MSGNTARQVDTARYIETMVRELETLALAEKLSFLAYLLGMAREEAAVRARRAKAEG